MQKKLYKLKKCASCSAQSHDMTWNQAFCFQQEEFQLTSSLPPTTGSATGDYLWMVWIRFVVKGRLCRAGALSPVLQVDKLLKMQNCCTILYTAAGKCCTPYIENNFAPPPCAIYYSMIPCSVLLLTGTDDECMWVHVRFSLGNQGYE